MSKKNQPSHSQSRDGKTTEVDASASKCDIENPDAAFAPPKPRTDAFTSTFHPTQYSQYEDEFEYNICSAATGTCVIFNNTHFDDGNTTRSGSDEDAKQLKDTFELLGFKTIIKCNLTCREMFDTVATEANDSSQHMDCFVCIILSHGKRAEFKNENKWIQGDFIHGTDSLMKLRHLTELVNDVNCHSLTGKPKIFITNTCRFAETSGLKAAEPVTYTKSKSRGSTAKQSSKTLSSSLQNTEEDEMDATKDTSFIRKIFNEVNSIIHDVPIFKDFILVCSTSPGFVSFRCANEGSFFIQALCQKLRDLHSTTDFSTILTRVNHQVAHEYESNISSKSDLDKKKQMPWIASKLTKLIYFR